VQSNSGDDQPGALGNQRGRPGRLAVLTPLPPTRTGVAHYASLLLPALAERVDVEAFASLDGYRREDFDHVIYQLGNNPHHEVMYAEAMREPGVVVLHDLVLHHLIVELTLARGDVDAYVAALAASHGAAGAAWARGRAAGLHTEMGNFLLPASVEVARRSRAVIVHNRYAADRLRSFGVETPIHVVPHPYVHDATPHDRDALRTRLGLTPDNRVIGLFGFLTSAKRADVVLEAFRIARERDSRLVLLIVGEPAPNIDVAALAGDGVLSTGYVADEEFPAYYAIADRLVNLRYPSAGETSGTLIRAFDAGKPVAVSDYAQFAELPDDCVTKIPFGDNEIALLADFFLRDIDVVAAQREWLEKNARVELTVEGYLAALSRTAGRWPAAPCPARARRYGALPLFANLEILSTRDEGATTIVTVRNGGETTLRTRTYGTPEIRLVVRTIADGRVVDDRWLALPCDLAPGAITELPFPRLAGELRFETAIQDVPSV
jgi:glycosyltransferase involved in cell wall biosynthesis